MFRDIELKRETLIDNILQELSYRGDFINRDYAEERISHIDLNMSIFKKELVSHGSMLDIEKINEMSKRIYDDINILYTILHEEETNNLKPIIESTNKYIESLKDIIKDIERRSEVELDLPLSGKTIFYQDRNFNYQEDSTIDLGKIKLNPNKLITLASSSDSTLKLIHSESGSTSIVKDRDTINISKPSLEYIETVTFPEHYKLNDAIRLLEKDSINRDSNYYILSTSHHFSLTQDEQRWLIPRSFNRKTEIENSGDLEVYILNGTYAHIDFKEEPDIKNFTSNSITITTPIKKIAMRTPRTNVGLKTDGRMYATCREGAVRQDGLYHPPVGDREFNIYEEKNKKEEYYAFLEIPENTELEYVALKETSGVIS